MVKISGNKLTSEVRVKMVLLQIDVNSSKLSCNRFWGKTKIDKYRCSLLQVSVSSAEWRKYIALHLIYNTICDYNQLIFIYHWGVLRQCHIIATECHDKQQNLDAVKASEPLPPLTPLASNIIQPVNKKNMGMILSMLNSNRSQVFYVEVTEFNNIIEHIVQVRKSCINSQ